MKNELNIDSFLEVIILLLFSFVMTVESLGTAKDTYDYSCLENDRN